MIYPKPRRINPKKSKRHMARTTPDEMVTYIDAFELDQLLDLYMIRHREKMVQMKIIFSYIGEVWLKRMKEKHDSAVDPYRYTTLQVEYDVSYNHYIFLARYQ